MSKQSIPYKSLCTEYYELDKPSASEEALIYYSQHAKEAKGPILEPMCGTGRFLIPLLEQGYAITGFDYSPHMLEVCRRKCEEHKLKPFLTEASFESFSPDELYNLILIPNGSFCLLTTPEGAHYAVQAIAHWLKPGGKFIFEVETRRAINESQGVWKGRWVDRKDGSKLLLNTLAHFDPLSRIETTLCRYEVWEENTITRTEVEDFRLRLYEPEEIEPLLKASGLTILNRWQAGPYTGEKATQTSPVILYECVKY